MLIVRWIEIGDVDRRELRSQYIRVFAKDRAGAGNQLRHPELHRLMRARCPSLEIRHLQAGRGIHAIGRQQQCGEQYRAFCGALGDAVERVANGINAAAVERLKIARLFTEGPRHIAIAPWQRIEILQFVGDRADGRRIVAIHCDVAGREHFTV